MPKSGAKKPATPQQLLHPKNRWINETETESDVQEAAPAPPPAAKKSSE